MTQQKATSLRYSQMRWRRSKAHVGGMNVVWREPPWQFCESLQTCLPLLEDSFSSHERNITAAPFSRSWSGKRWQLVLRISCRDLVTPSPPSSKRPQWLTFHNRVTGSLDATWPKHVTSCHITSGGKEKVAGTESRALSVALPVKLNNAPLVCSQIPTQWVHFYLFNVLTGPDRVNPFLTWERSSERKPNESKCLLQFSY